MRSPGRSLFALALFAAACVPAAIAGAELSSETPRMHGGGIFRSLSPEQKMMLFADMRRATSGMTDDRRKEYRQNRREKFAAMTDSEKQEFAAKLQSEWDSLPADQRASIKQEVMTWRAQRWNRNGANAQGHE